MSDVTGIVWENENRRIVVVTNLDQIKFVTDIVKVKVIVKSGKSYFKIST